MANAVVSLLFGMVFGLALAAPPGPMNAVIAEESVLRGWTAGFKAGLGAMTADFAFFVLSLLGVVTFVRSMATLQGVLVGVGGLLMLYFAYGAVRNVESFTGGEGAATAEGTDSRGFWKALVLALTNPYQIVFWLTVGVGLLRPGTADLLSHAPYVGDAAAGLLVVETGSPELLLGLFLGIVVWIVGFPGSLVLAGRRIDRFAPVVAYTSAVALGLFGGWYLVQAAETLALL